MDKNSFCYALNNYQNPYLSLVNSIENTEQDGSLKNLFEFIKKNTFSDINEEKFNMSHYKSLNNENFIQISLSNILHDLSILSYKNNYSWQEKNPFELFEALSFFGLDFTKETRVWNIPFKNSTEFLSNIKTKEEFIEKIENANIKEESTSTIFNMASETEERNICLIGIAYKQMENEQFQNLIKKYNTLHQAVTYKKENLIKFLIEDCSVDPNIQNNDCATPVMFCRNIDILNILNKYDINWFSKNILNKDCIEFFTSISDKEQSKQMVDLAQKRMAETFSEHKNNDIDPEYIQKRIKQNLLEMVKFDKTKKELEDFIKKYKIKDFSDVFDENGNSLALICLKNHNWARYNLFKKSYNLTHVNNNNDGSLEVLFKERITGNIDTAKDIFKELLLYNVQIKNTKFSENILLQHFQDSSILSFPHWYAGNNPYEFAEQFIKDEYAYKFSQEYNKYKKGVVSYQVTDIKNDSGYLKSKSIAYFLLHHINQYNKEYKLSVLPLNIFSENKCYNDSKINYSIDNVSLINFIAVYNTIKENGHLNDFGFKEFFNRFEQKSVEHLIKDCHSDDTKTNESSIFHENFVTKNKALISFLVDEESELLLSILSTKFIDKFINDKELYGKLGYFLLQKNVSNNHTNKKTNKI